MSKLGAALLLSVALAACESPPPPAPDPRPSGGAAPTLTAMPGGGEMIEPPLREVLTLRRQADGRYKRLCGPPDAKQRAMMEQAFRGMAARRGQP